MTTAFIKKARRSRRRRQLKPIKPSRAIELWYHSQLLKMITCLMADLRQKLEPVLKSKQSPLVQDATFADILADIFRVWESQAGTVSRRVARRVAPVLANRVLNAVSEGLAATISNALALDVSSLFKPSTKLSTAIDAAVATNIDLIRSLPDQYLERIKASVYSGVVGGSRWEDVMREIVHIESMTTKRARLIARDQVSKMNGAITRIRQTELGIEKYKWSTSHDERVRPTHRAHDGKIFRWDDPPADTGHPGDDYQCRCVAIAIIDYGEDD